MGLQCKYVAFLGAKCCLQHKKTFSFIDLFAGAGGFSLGLKNAGLKHVYGLDNWPVSCKTYVANIGTTICSSIEILEPPVLNLGVDLLVASPPCQAFSLANRRGSNAAENSSLYLHILKFLNLYRPKLFVLENVSGILSYKSKIGLPIIKLVKDAFSSDYNVKIFKICCSDFGVAQNRKRVIIIGVRKDINLFFPNLKKHPCTTTLRSFVLPRIEVSDSFFLSKKAISGIHRRQLTNGAKSYGFGAQYVDLDAFCNTITANY